MRDTERKHCGICRRAPGVGITCEAWPSLADAGDLDWQDSRFDDMAGRAASDLTAEYPHACTAGLGTPLPAGW